MWSHPAQRQQNSSCCLFLFFKSAFRMSLKTTLVWRLYAVLPKHMHEDDVLSFKNAGVGFFNITHFSISTHTVLSFGNMRGRLSEQCIGARPRVTAQMETALTLSADSKALWVSYLRLRLLKSVIHHSATEFYSNRKKMAINIKWLTDSCTRLKDAL